MTLETKNIFNNVALIDFVKKATTVLAVIYLGCFALESFLPGIVIEAFNFNLLLFLIVGMMTFLVSAGSDKNQDIKKNVQSRVLIALSLVFLLTMFVVLYKTSLLETIVYLALTLVLIRQIKVIFSQTS